MRTVFRLVLCSLLPMSAGWASELPTPAPPATGSAAKAPAAAQPATSPAGNDAAAALSRKPAYRPPKVGKPGVTVAGITRGGTSDGGRGVVLEALVPKHTGTTFEAQPTLYWYQSKPTKARLELVLIAPHPERTVYKAAWDANQMAGVHALALAQVRDAGGKPVAIEPGVVYQWNLALVLDSESRSKDLVAGGLIERSVPSAELVAQLANAGPGERACLLAEHGAWYDALASLLELVSRHPGDPSFKSATADLLVQVGLKEAAAAVRR